MKIKQGMIFLISICITFFIGSFLLPKAMDKEEAYNKLQIQLQSIEEANKMNKDTLTSLFTLADVHEDKDTLAKTQETIKSIFVDDEALALTTEEETAFTQEIYGIYQDSIAMAQDKYVMLRNSLRYASLLIVIICILIYSKIGKKVNNENIKALKQASEEIVSDVKDIEENISEEANTEVPVLEEKDISTILKNEVLSDVNERIESSLEKEDTV